MGQSLCYRVLISGLAIMYNSSQSIGYIQHHRETLNSHLGFIFDEGHCISGEFELRFRVWMWYVKIDFSMVVLWRKSEFGFKFLCSIIDEGHGKFGLRFQAWMWYVKIEFLEDCNWTHPNAASRSTSSKLLIWRSLWGLCSHWQTSDYILCHCTAWYLRFFWTILGTCGCKLIKSKPLLSADMTLWVLFLVI